MADLEQPMSRDERQKICIKKWLANRGIGTLCCCTGFGKTYMSISAIKLVLSKYPNFKVLVVVPTTNLKDQWNEYIVRHQLKNNVDVVVINTAVKHDYNVDMLVIDEIHKTAAKTLSHVFNCVKYKLILGLTGTFERLDGRHEIVRKYCPVIDTITAIEAVTNGWLSHYIEYEVLLDVDNIEEYKAMNRAFNGHFEFFNYDFSLCMSLIGKGGFEKRKEYTSSICKDPKRWSEVLKTVTFHAIGFMRALKDRKLFVNNHSKKIEIARKIIEARSDRKIITFSNNIKMAESIGGPTYSGKDTKKKGRITLGEFMQKDTGVLNSVAKLIEGFDCPGLSVAIVLGLDSSKTKAVQKLGRIIRFEPGKSAEIFNLVINDTAEVEWFRKSHTGTSYITIDEENLMHVLNGEPFSPYRKPVEQFNYRF